MATFTPGQTITLSLDADDVVTFDGGATYTYTPTTGSKGAGTTTGVQTFGPYGQYVTLVFVATSAGTYTRTSDATKNANAVCATDAAGNAVAVVGPSGRKSWLSPMHSSKGAFKWFGSNPSADTVNVSTGLSASAASYGYKVEAEAPFDAVRLVWVNRAANAINTCTAIVGVTETAGYASANEISELIIGGAAQTALATSTSILGWRSVTWSGASSVSIGAATTAVQFGVSDWIPLSSIARTDSGTRPLLSYRGQHDGSVDGNFAFLGTGIPLNRTPTAANRGRIVQTCQPTSGVSTPSNTASSFGNNAFELFPVFRYTVPSLTVMVAGDSIEQNDGLARNTYPSWGWRGCADASSTTRPVNYMNVGCSSKGSAVYIARLKEFVAAGVVPDVLVVSPASVNDWGSNTTADQLARLTETWRYQVYDLIDYAYANKIPNIAFIPLFPYNTLSALQDTYRKAFNSFLAALVSPGVAVLSFSLGDGASPEKWIPAYSVKSGWQYVSFTLPKTSVSATSYVGATTYTATITVDSVACPISFVGSTASTFSDLLSVLNTQVNAGMGTSGVTYVSLDAGNLLVQSNTTGSSSTVSVTAGTAFASPLANFSQVATAVAGTADGLHPNESCIDTVMAPTLADYLASVA